MEQVFWIMWKAAVPLLAIVVAYLLLTNYEQRQEIRELDDTVDSLRRCNKGLRTHVNAALDDAMRTKQELSEARNVIVELQHQFSASECGRQLKAKEQRIDYLWARNQQLTLAALAAAGKFIRTHDC